MSPAPTDLDRIPVIVGVGEALDRPSDLAKALDTNPAARAHWNEFPPSARKAMLWWLVTAAKNETRQRRIDTIVDRAGRGERAQG